MTVMSVRAEADYEREAVKEDEKTETFKLKDSGVCVCVC